MELWINKDIQDALPKAVQLLDERGTFYPVMTESGVKKAYLLIANMAIRIAEKRE